MKTIFLLLEIAVLSLLLSGCNSNGTSESADLGVIKAEGRWMVDDEGRVLMIHGVNQVNKLPPYDAASLGFDQEDAELLRNYGFNAVRLGVMWAAIEPTRGQYNKDYLESIRQTVKLLKAQGIYSLLDFHQDAFSVNHGGSGFPDWAALGTGTVSDKAFPFMYFDLFNTAVSDDFDSFWNNQDGIQDSYMDMLTLVVETLGNEDGVLGVEFINEPFPGTQWTQCRESLLSPLDFSQGCQEFDSGHLTNFYNKAIEHIRSVNSTIMVVYDENTLGGLGAPPFISTIQDDNALFSWHNYLATDFATPFKDAQNYQKLSGSAILMTEFGANPDPDNWREVLSLSDSNLMSWMFWAYSNNPPYKIMPVAGFGTDGGQQGLVYDLSKPMDANLTDANKSIVRDVNLDVARVEAISRPYPQWTAGIPQELDYNTSTNILTFKWSFKDYKGKNAKTELFVPKHSYPKGYKVTTQNCRVISRPYNNTKLVVENNILGNSFDGEIMIMPLDK